MDALVLTSLNVFGTHVSRPVRPIGGRCQVHHRAVQLSCVLGITNAVATAIVRSFVEVDVELRALYVSDALHSRELDASPREMG